jgi:hypothetical protein
MQAYEVSIKGGGYGRAGGGETIEAGRERGIAARCEGGDRTEAGTRVWASVRFEGDGSGESYLTLLASATNRRVPFLSAVNEMGRPSKTLVHSGFGNILETFGRFSLVFLFLCVSFSWSFQVRLF